MFNALDSALFRLINEFARSSFLDMTLPYLSGGPVLLALIVAFFFIYAIYSRKKYEDTSMRLLSTAIFIGLSVIVSTLGASLLKDVFERTRPYLAINNAVYYDQTSQEWFVVQRDAQKVIESETVSVVTQNSTEEMSSVNDETLGVSKEKAEGMATDKTAGTGTDTLNNSQQEALAEQAGGGGAGLEGTQISVSSEGVATEGVAEFMEITEFAEVESSRADSYPVLQITQADIEQRRDSKNFSMPSVFAINTMAIAFIINLLFPRTFPWIYLCPILVGWSRVYVGQSYPLDVLVGWILSFVTVAIAWFLCEFFFRRVSKSHKL